MDGEPTPPTQSRAADLAQVCWNDPEQRVVTCQPLPKARAEALAQAFSRVFPRSRYWIEPLPWLRRREDA